MPITLPPSVIYFPLEKVAPISPKRCLLSLSSAVLARVTPLASISFIQKSNHKVFLHSGYGIAPFPRVKFNHLPVGIGIPVTTASPSACTRNNTNHSHKPLVSLALRQNALHMKSLVQFLLHQALHHFVGCSTPVLLRLSCLYDCRNSCCTPIFLTEEIRQ